MARCCPRREPRHKHNDNPAKILLAVIVVLLALPVVFAVVVGNLDWNRFKPTINDKVTAAIGRPFAIRGDLSVSWGRQPQESGWRAWLPWPRRRTTRPRRPGQEVGPRPGSGLFGRGWTSPKIYV